MQCNYFINNVRQCKLYTDGSSEYCHHHKKIVEHRFPKPKNCPVCFCSVNQCVHPLSCGHWVHKICIQKSGKAECPICRHELKGIKITDTSPTDFDGAFDALFEDLLIDPDIERFDIPEEALIIAVVSYQLYAYVLYPDDRSLGLEDFIAGVISDIIPSSTRGITSILYGEALRIFFNPSFSTMISSR